MDPFLKWAGGKRWQLPFLRPLYTALRSPRLVEPFCGGLSVALGLEPARAWLNDANPHLINLYTQVQRGLVFDLDMEPESYYANRDWFNTLVREHPEGEMAAQLFYYLNRVGFNGLCRFSKEGTFNVPVGTARGVPPLDVATYQAQFRDWRFTCGDFRSVTPEADDLVYADPPYDAGFTAYTSGSFSWDDQVDLATRLAAHPGPVILTNRATDRILTLYRDQGFDVQTLPAPRRIGGNRADVLEVVATRHCVDVAGIMAASRS